MKINDKINQALREFSKGNKENAYKELLKIFKKDTPKSLALRILVQEHALYPKAIKKILANL